MATILDPTGDPIRDPDGDLLTIGVEAPALEALPLVVHGGTLTPLRPIAVAAGHLTIHGGTIRFPVSVPQMGGILRFPIGSYT